jgi:NaMN:DMB phosphoribosyltransferase
MNQRPILLRKKGAAPPESFWTQLARKASANLALVLVDVNGHPTGGFQSGKELNAGEAAALLDNKEWKVADD